MAQPRLTHISSDVVHARSFLSPQSCKLVYMDPPFRVGVQFRARGTDGTRAGGPVAYTDVWPSMQAYTTWLLERAAAAWDCLANDGTLWLHLDHRAVHDMKVAFDQAFGAKCFRGEIIWVPGNGGRARNGPNHTHQTLLVYSKAKGYLWNANDPCMREPYAETSTRMHFTHIDADGRAYRERKVGGKVYRYAADRGRALGSVWTDCPSMVANSPIGAETTGYPTQKPLKLLDRIVRVSTNTGDLVLDAFSGSGTTLVASANAKRSAVGFDIGALSRQVCAARCDALGLKLKIR